MIIAKKILCGALSFCLIFALCSCQKTDEKYPFDGLSDGETDPIPAYRIVLPAECSAALYEKAESLSLLLSGKVGARVTVKFDYETVLDAEVPELLLGYTSRPLSKEFLASLKRDDYLCRSDGRGGAVIGGKTDGATLAAVDRFCAEILPSATAERLMSEEVGFFYEGSYTGERALLNGFELNRYCLVYPNGADAEIRELLHRFRDGIAARSGYVLDVFSDTEIQGVEKQIRLTVDSDEARGYLACIDPTSTGIEISSRGIFGFSVGLSELETLLFASEENGVFRCDVSCSHSVPYEGDTYRIGSIQTKSGITSFTPVTLTDLLTPVIERVPDGVLLDGMKDQETMERVSSSLRHEEYQGLSIENGDALSAFAKGDAMTAMAVESVWDGGPTVTAFRAGSEKYGFYLIWVGGAVSRDGILTLPQGLSDSKLPVVLLIHTKQAGGTLTPAAEDFYGMRAWCNESYSVEGEAYLFQCYATDGSLEIEVAADDGNSRYREITVKRSSQY